MPRPAGWGAIYAHGCARRPPEGSYRTHWMVCDACSPEFTPACGLCGAPSPVDYVTGGFRAHPWGILCPPCVERVQSGGPWKVRRAVANAARAEALCARFSSLTTYLRGRTTHVEGNVAGRAVHVRLRLAAREGASERYVMHVGYAGPVDAVTQASLGLEPKLHGFSIEGSVKVTHDRGRWLRIGFSHLGKLDTVSVLTTLLASAERLERA